MRLNIAESKISRYIFSYSLLGVIAIIDFYTGNEASSVLLYFFPIYLIASHPQTKRHDAAIIAFFCTLVWLLIDVSSSHYHSSPLIFFWNGLVRMAIFMILSAFIYINKKERRKVEHVNAQLRILNEEKNKYLGVAAHDIRNPLGSISNLALLLQDDGVNLTEQQKKFVALIYKLSYDGLDMLNNILDIAQIEAGSLKIRPTVNEYISFVREVIDNNQYLAEKKKQQIIFESENDELSITYDQAYLQQALNNLLTNAIKYSYPDSTIRVTVQKDAQTITTSVTDRGVGIKEEDRSKVFRPFEKAQNKPTAGEYSSGLGLAITKKIVEAHQGKLHFVSEYGKGSTFSFNFPLVYPEEKLASAS